VSCKACIALGLRHGSPKIEVDEDACVRCGNCAFYCPYEAVKLVYPGAASFDLVYCKGCGLCVAKCPAMALKLESWERERISALISKLSSEMEKPKILVFRCQWGVFPPLDGEFSKNIRAIDLPCAARVDILHILEAFQKGVDGVLIAACPEEDCKRERGSREAQRSVAALQERLGQIGFQERLHFCTVAPRCVEVFDKELAQFSQRIADVLAKEAT